jgi:hypothetical protein
MKKKTGYIAGVYIVEVFDFCKKKYSGPGEARAPGRFNRES